MLTKKDEETVTNIVVDAIKDMVMPALERLFNKIEETKSDLGKLATRVEQMDRKLDIFSAKVVADEAKLDDHEKRLKHLESSLTT